jgi:uracil-DNA glycosylase family 4
MPNFVPGDGPSSAKLVVVGEGPGKWEDEYVKPFCGPSGELVNSMLAEAGTSRDEVYVTNVCKIRPPDNDLSRLGEYGRTIEEFIPILWNEINSIGPNAVLALGDTALKYLTGKTGITKYRGSILESINGYPKIIPSIHPANLLEHRREGMFKWKDKVYIQLDFNKAVKESEFKEFRLPQRNVWICKHSYDLIKFIERNRGRSCALDIETYKALPLCLALSFHPAEAVSIPLLDLLSNLNPDGISLSEMTQIWDVLLRFLNDETIRKIGQNFKFDEKILCSYGLKLQGFNSDTMLKFHTLYCEFPKRLEFQTSILTNEPYYKSEGREYNPKKDKLSRLLLYNARDAAVTKEIDEILEGELEEKGLKDYFYNFTMKLHYFYMKLESNGLLLNRERYNEIVAKYKVKLKENDESLQRLVGYEFNTDSNPEYCNILYNQLKFPKRTERRSSGKSTLSANEKALLSLIANVKCSEEKKDVPRLMLRHRAIRKTLSDYLGVPKNAKSKIHYEDNDGRVRTQYLITGTETFRTSTNKLEPPVRPEIYGLSFQTVTKHSQEGQDIRSCFMPTPGYAFIEVDQSQAESRIALLLAKEYELLRKMDEIDIHTLTASWINGRTYEEQFARHNEIERQMGKHSGHAYDNGVGKRRLVEMVYHHSDGVIEISEWKAGKILETLYQFKPGIKDVFHKDIQDVLAETRELVNPWGDKRTFYDRYGDDMFKDAYAHIKQSTVARLTQKSGMAIIEECPHVRMLVESHDSLLMEVPVWEIEQTIPIIKKNFEQTIDFSKCSLPRPNLNIPCDIRYSFVNWAEMRKIEEIYDIQ